MDEMIIASVDGINFNKCIGKTHKQLNGKVSLFKIFNEKDELQQSFLMQPVKSSNITHVGFIESPGESILILLYSNGGLYYYTVPTDVIQTAYMSTVNSESVGKYVNKEIKGTYKYVKAGMV